jgi:hypothetical protein
MSTDWNEKLAFFLHRFPDQALGLPRRATTPYPILRGLRAEPARAELDSLERRAQIVADWLASATDRPPLAPAAASDPPLDWPSAPEITHPVSFARLALEPFDARAAEGALSAVLDEVVSRYGGDPRRQFLWLWRFLPERLAALDGGLGSRWHRVPADPRAPDHTVWQHLSLMSAFGAAGPDPAVLVLDVGVPDRFLAEVHDAADLRAAAAIVSWLAWEAIRPLAAALGPDAVLQPALRHHPLADAWLASEGVTLAPGEPAPRGPRFGTLGPQFVALAPSAEVERLAGECVTAVRTLWHDLGRGLRDALASAGWAERDAQGWLDLWHRQLGRALDPRWVAVAMQDDSTGAGAMLPSREIAAFDRAVRQRRDASGRAPAGRGAFYNIWHDAALAASAARSNTVPCALEASERDTCSLCARREPLPKVRELAEPFGRALGDAERLCVPCALKRLARRLPGSVVPGLRQVDPGPGHDEAAGSAVVLFEIDSLDAVLRGGLDTKDGSTLRSVLHAAMPGRLLGARSRWKDILDAPVLGGPSRHAALSDALRDFSLGSAPAVVEAHGGSLVHAASAQLLALLPASRSLEAARALRDTVREAFVERVVLDGEPARPGLHLGHAVTASCAIVLVRGDGGLRGALLAARAVLDELARDVVGRDAVVISACRPPGRRVLLAAHWDGFGEHLGLLVEALRGPRNARAFVRQLAPILPALLDADLDRVSSDSRLGLLRPACVAARLAPDLAAADPVARAVLALLDRNAAPGAYPEGGHALDGLRIAEMLAREVS